MRPTLRCDRRVQRGDWDTRCNRVAGQIVVRIGGLGGGDADKDKGDDGDAPVFHGSSPLDFGHAC